MLASTIKYMAGNSFFVFCLFANYFITWFVKLIRERKIRLVWKYTRWPKPNLISAHALRTSCEAEYVALSLWERTCRMWHHGVKGERKVGARILVCYLYYFLSEPSTFKIWNHCHCLTGFQIVSFIFSPWIGNSFAINFADAIVSVLLSIFLQWVKYLCDLFWKPYLMAT